MANAMHIFFKHAFLSQKHLAFFYFHTCDSMKRFGEVDKICTCIRMLSKLNSAFKSLCQVFFNISYAPREQAILHLKTKKKTSNSRPNTS